LVALGTAEDLMLPLGTAPVWATPLLVTVEL